jgi:uncharacterized membrane protein YhhN
MKTILLAVLYFLIAIFHIISSYRFPGLPAYILKTLIIPVLAVILITNIRQNWNSTHILIFAALFFSWAGDVLLQTKAHHASMFIPGLIAFFLAHIMYMTVFFSTPGESMKHGSVVWQLLPLILYGTILVLILYNDLGSMKVPVILYAIVILTMVFAAITRYGKVELQSYLLVLAGAILFVISDSALAINKFSHPFNSSGLVVMSTYVVAQFMIVAGYILQFKKIPA